MIVTLTPNPSVDATLELGGPLEPGAVQRTVAYSHVAGGKGLNVSHAVHLAGAPTLALFPAANRDGFLSLVESGFNAGHLVYNVFGGFCQGHGVSCMLSNEMTKRQERKWLRYHLL